MTDSIYVFAVGFWGCRNMLVTGSPPRFNCCSGVFNEFDNCVTLISWNYCLWFLNRLAWECSGCHGYLVVRFCALSLLTWSSYVLSVSSPPKHNKLHLNRNVWVDRVFALGWTADPSKVLSLLSPRHCWDELQCHGDPGTLCLVRASSCNEV